MPKESIPKFQFLKDKFLHSAKERVTRGLIYQEIEVLSTAGIDGGIGDFVIHRRRDFLICKNDEWVSLMKRKKAL